MSTSKPAAGCSGALGPGGLQPSTVPVPAAPGADAGAVPRHRVPDTPGGSMEHLPYPTSSQRAQDVLGQQPTQSQGSQDELLRKPPKSQEFKFLFIIFFSFSPFKSYLFHVRWSRGVPPLPLCPRACPGWWDGVRFLFARCFFASTITQTVTSFTRKHWRVPRSGSNLSLCTG